MSPQDSLDAFVSLLRQSQLISDERLEEYVAELDSLGMLPDTPPAFAELLVRDGLLTGLQAEELLRGKWKRFTIGKYKVLELLGSGGMGEVYLCENERMKRRVAIKVMPSAASRMPGAVERFEREAKIAAALNHPNIVRTYDFDQDGETRYIVMEYVEGLTLHDLTKRKSPLPISDVCHYMSQAAQALQHGHESGLIHRDLKPGNIIVDLQGTARLMDLGLARLAHDELDNVTRRFNKSGILGTIDFLAPEQARDCHTVDIRADIYGLGCTMYYCLTGRAPFDSGTPNAKLIAHQTRQPDSIYKSRPEIPLGLVVVLNRMIAKAPEKRYQTPAEVVAALAPWAKPPDKPFAAEDLPQFSLAARNVGLPAVPAEPPPTDAVTVKAVAPLSDFRGKADSETPRAKRARLRDTHGRSPHTGSLSKGQRVVLWVVLLISATVGVAGGTWLATRGNVKTPGATSK